MALLSGGAKAADSRSAPLCDARSRPQARWILIALAILAFSMIVSENRW